MRPSPLSLLVSVSCLLLAPAARANGSCGGHGQRECNVWEQIPSCDPGLSASGGRCYHCGGVGEMECAVTVQVPSCDANLMAIGGTCQRCGGLGEPICAATVLAAGCREHLIGQEGVCRSCGLDGEEACRSLTLEATCRADTLVLREAGAWFTCVPCGAEGHRPCPPSTGRAPCGGEWLAARPVPGRMGLGASLCQPCGSEGALSCDATDFQGRARARCMDGWFPAQPVNTLPERCVGCGERGAPPCEGDRCTDDLWAVNGVCKHCTGTNADRDCPAARPSAAPAPAPAPPQPPRRLAPSGGMRRPG